MSDFKDNWLSFGKLLLIIFGIMMLPVIWPLALLYIFLKLFKII